MSCVILLFKGIQHFHLFIVSILLDYKSRGFIYKWLLKSISSVKILLDVPITRDVRLSNSSPRDNDNPSSYIWNWIPLYTSKKQGHSHVNFRGYDQIFVAIRSRSHEMLRNAKRTYTSVAKTAHVKIRSKIPRIATKLFVATLLRFETKHVWQCATVWHGW